MRDLVYEFESECCRTSNRAADPLDVRLTAPDETGLRIVVCRYVYFYLFVFTFTFVFVLKVVAKRRTPAKTPPDETSRLLILCTNFYKEKRTTDSTQRHPYLYNK